MEFRNDKCTRKWFSSFLRRNFFELLFRTLHKQFFGVLQILAISLKYDFSWMFPLFVFFNVHSRFQKTIYFILPYTFHFCRLISKIPCLSKVKFLMSQTLLFSQIWFFDFFKTEIIIHWWYVNHFWSKLTRIIDKFIK